MSPKVTPSANVSPQFEPLQETPPEAASAALSPISRQRTNSPATVPDTLMQSPEHLAVSSAVSLAAETLRAQHTPEIQNDPICQCNLGFWYQNGVIGQDLPDQTARDVLAFQHYSRSASLGLAAAQNNLGFLYESDRAGLDLPDHASRAMLAAYWYEQAAMQGHSAAQTSLAFLYLNGHVGGPNQTDRDKATAHWLKKAADLGNMIAQTTLGQMLRDGRAGMDLPNQAARDILAAHYFGLAAAQGLPMAQCHLGMMAIEGRAALNLPDQLARDAFGVQLLEQAAEKGCALAQCHLGQLILSNRAWVELENPAERDAKAVSLLRQAAEQNCDSAEYILGLLLERGRAGLDLPDQAARDFQALYWYSRAAAHGNYSAEYSIGYLYFKGRAGLNLENQAARDVYAVQWLKSAADPNRGNNTMAQNYLGRMCEMGRVGPDEHDQAEHWFGLSAAQGDAFGQARLGSMYALGNAGRNLADQTTRDSIATYWLQKGAENGNASAQYLLGYLYATGRAGLFLANQDARNDLAAHWYERAALQGHGLARYNLGKLYQEGYVGRTLDLEKRLAIAFLWFNPLTASETEVQYPGAKQYCSDIQGGKINLIEGLYRIALDDEHPDALNVLATMSSPTVINQFCELMKNRLPKEHLLMMHQALARLISIGLTSLSSVKTILEMQDNTLAEYIYERIECVVKADEQDATVTQKREAIVAGEEITKLYQHGLPIESNYALIALKWLAAQGDQYALNDLGVDIREKAFDGKPFQTELKELGLLARQGVYPAFDVLQKLAVVNDHDNPDEPSELNKQAANIMIKLINPNPSLG